MFHCSDSKNVSVISPIRFKSSTRLIRYVSATIKGNFFWRFLIIYCRKLCLSPILVRRRSKFQHEISLWKLLYVLKEACLLPCAGSPGVLQSICSRIDNANWTTVDGGYLRHTCHVIEHSSFVRWIHHTFYFVPSRSGVRIIYHSLYCLSRIFTRYV